MSLKLTQSQLEEVRRDLRRPHAFACERVGFLYGKIGSVKNGRMIICAAYMPVLDSDYIPDSRVGARIGSGAIRSAMQVALSDGLAVLHVHLHDCIGQPAMSRTDDREMRKLIPAFFNVRPELPHAAVIVSTDSLSAWIWLHAGRGPVQCNDITVVGSPMLVLRRC